jgi:hypothetical protein
MLGTIILPEYLVGKAFGDYISTSRFKKEQTDQWTVTHAFYANSGGFLLEFPPPLKPTAINTAQLSYLLQNNVIDSTPTISEAEITEKGQGDFFAKLSAMLQLLRLVIQLITRKALNLPSTKIEISALSFAICSLVTYTLWFWKPQNPQIPTHISLNPVSDWKIHPLDLEKFPDLNLEGYIDLTPEAYLHLTPEGKLLRSLELYLAMLVAGSFFTQALFKWKDDRALAKTFPNDRYNWNSELWIDEYGATMPVGRKEYYMSLEGEDVGFILGGAILGACHCIAWNFDFPTPIERTFWRVAIIVIISIMPLYYLLCVGYHFLEKGFDFHSSAGDIPLGWLAFTLFGLARLYLLGAAFRDLFFLPPEAFVTTWAASFPGFG